MFPMTWTPSKARSPNTTESPAVATDRRNDRKRLRANMGTPVRYSPARPDVGQDGYESSDVDDDIQGAIKQARSISEAKPSIDTRDQIKAKRLRLERRADLIKETLGSGKLVADAIYFSKISALNIEGNYRPAMDHIADQTPKVTDDRLNGHNEVSEEIFWKVVMTHMKRKHTGGFIGTMAADIVEGLSQGTHEGVGEYAARTKNARAAAIKFMTIELHSDREITQFKINFNTGWIKGLTLQGELPITHSTAVKTNNQMLFKDIRSMAEAIEEHKRQDSRDGARAPALVSNPQGAGRPARRSLQSQPQWADPSGADPAQTDTTQTQSAADAPALAAVAKLAELVKGLQEETRKSNEESKRAINALRPKQGGKGNAGDGKGGDRHTSWQDRPPKLEWNPHPAWAPPQGTPPGPPPGWLPNPGPPHEWTTQYGWGPATGPPQTWNQGQGQSQHTATKPQYNPYDQSPNGSGAHTSGGGAPQRPGPPPPLPGQHGTQRIINCRVCEQSGADPNHEYKHCPQYGGCGVCDQKGHYGSECSLPCKDCKQASTIKGRRHQINCPRVPQLRKAF